MRIAIHDFAGHPFQVQLSRELARRGHTVTHLYLRDLPGPKGRLEADDQDPRSFSSAPVSLGAPFEKYSMLKRHFAHRRYARALTSLVADERPDVVLSANTPIDVQHHLLGECRRRGIAFVHWMQDLYCMAIRTVLMQKLGRCSLPLAWRYDRMERAVCEGSQAVVFITDDFHSVLSSLKFRLPSRTYIVENWAPLDELTPVAKSNPWSVRHGLSGKLVFLYSGTLGLKHKPELLYELAEGLEGREDAVVVVISEGLGREWLERVIERRPLKNLVLMDFQPFTAMSEVLGAADVLVAILEEDAGVFAVPSKVLSYLCAGRPVLLAGPDSNLAARTIARARAGVTVSPNHATAFVEAARHLAEDRDVRRSFAANAREYAEATFDIRSIAARFESILREAVLTTGNRPEPAASYASPEIVTSPLAQD